MLNYCFFSTYESFLKNFMIKNTLKYLFELKIRFVIAKCQLSPILLFRCRCK